MNQFRFRSLPGDYLTIRASSEKGDAEKGGAKKSGSLKVEVVYLAGTEKDSHLIELEASRESHSQLIRLNENGETQVRVQILEGALNYTLLLNRGHLTHLPIGRREAFHARSD